jgi:hypothetical protein
MSGGREWLLAAGLLAGYALLMFATSVRHCLVDGARVLRRYPRVWMIPAGLGLCYTLFQSAVTLFFIMVVPWEQKPAFGWKLIWRMPQWSSTMHEAHTLHDWVVALLADPRWEMVQGAGLQVLESLAGLFNCVVTTSPIAAIGAIVLLVNWQNHHSTLRKALRKRFGKWGLAVHAGIIVCAISAVLEPGIYVALNYLGQSPRGVLLLRWGTLIDTFSNVFAYLFGIGVQIYLILVVYTWLRGLNWTPVHLMDLAIRRFSFVVKWASVVLAISAVMIDLPRVVGLLFRFDDPAFLDHTFFYTDRIARPLLALFLICFSTMQITLTFHSETLSKALHQHLQFIARFWGQMVWFTLIAAVNLFLLACLDYFLQLGFLGDLTLGAVIWSLVHAVVRGILLAWLLAAWVSLYKRCESGRVTTPDWIPY